MNLRLKLSVREEIENMDLVRIVDDGAVNRVKINANSLKIEKDTKDERFLKSINNIKMVVELEDGCIIMFGNLRCEFREPFGGAFFIKRILLDEGCNFENVIGVSSEVTFTNNPISIDEMRNVLESIKSSKDFLFNLTQFDEFMDIFGYYKELSDELNNNASFELIDRSQPYFFIPVNNKGLKDSEEELLDLYSNLEEVFDSNGIIKGYIVENYALDQMETELRDGVEELIDLRFKSKDKVGYKISKMKDNLYLSDFSVVSNYNSKKMKEVQFKNLNHDKDDYTITIVNDEDLDYRFLNLYDMGQKVKVESIENSLRLINQGNSGSAIELISYLIGDKSMPNTQLTTPKGSEKYTEGLNASQKKAFLKAVDDCPVTLIKGPPGTGKTHVINAITQYITKELGEKVVIASQTHVAIDNVLDKLMENYDLVVPNRVTNKKNKYSGNEIDKTLFNTWGNKFSKHNKRVLNKTLANAMEKEYDSFKGSKKFKFYENMDQSEYDVIGCTTTTTRLSGKKGIELLKGYNWLIIDEVSKCPITEVLRYLPYIEKIVMVGDDYQLAPLLEFRKEDVSHLEIYNEDKFEKLQEVYQKSVFADTIDKARKNHRLVELDINYRSLPTVLDAYNVFYGYDLKCSRLEVEGRNVFFEKELDYMNENDISFIYVKGGKEIIDSRQSRYNVEELEATRDLLNKVIEYAKEPSKVSVAAIFPYSAQISRFYNKNRDLINSAKRLFKDFDIDTVDAFQGKESDIVIVNTVITDPNRKNFLSDFKRINVSMSRAKDKLFILGNRPVLSGLNMSVYDGSKRKYFKEIIDEISRNGFMMKYVNGEGLTFEDSSKIKTKIRKAS